MALIGEDATITIRFGSLSGGVITWDPGGAFSITGKARRISAEDSVELANTKAIGDLRKKHRSHSGGTRIDIDTVVGYGGYGFLNTGRASPVGFVAQVTMKELSSLTLPVVLPIGIVDKWKGDISDTEVQIETLSIMCDVDGA